MIAPRTIGAACFLALSLSISANWAAAQTGPQVAVRLTLAQAVERAEANYPRIRAAAERRQAAEAEVGVARSAYLPRTDVLWQSNRATANNVDGLLLPQSVVPSISGPVLPSDNGRSAWSSASGALFSWEPFDFGARRAQVDFARYGAAAATATESLTRLNVALATADAFFDVVSAQQFEAVARANVDRLQTFANSVGVLVKQQLRPGADASQADAGLAQARTQLIQAHTNVVVRRAALAELTGLSPEQFTVDDTQILGSVPRAEGEGPLSSHPAAQREAALVRQQQARLTGLVRSYAPQFNTEAAVSARGAGTSLNGNFPGGTNGLTPDTVNWAVGVQMSFPVLDFFSIRSQKRVQQANLRADQQEYKQTMDDISVGVQQAEAQLEGARAAAQNTPSEVKAARDSEAQQRARFSAGLATVVDVAAAESLLVQAEADDAVARVNVWRAAAGVAAARGDLASFTAQLGRP